MNSSNPNQLMVEMVRNARAVHGRDRFACTLEQWHALLSLAKEHGWDPQGTTYKVPPKSKVTLAAIRDYEPGDAADPKMFAADDAIALARALMDARDSLAEKESINGIPGDTMRGLISEFAQYAFGGDFAFAYESTNAES
jgi:hypothetical protein